MAVDTLADFVPPTQGKERAKEPGLQIPQIHGVHLPSHMTQRIVVPDSRGPC